MPQYRTFNLGDAIAKGQSLSANRFRLGEAPQTEEEPQESPENLFNKVYHFGVISFCYRIPFRGSLEQLKLNLIEVKQEFDKKSEEDAQNAFERIKPVIEHPHFYNIKNNYFAVHVNPRSDRMESTEFKEKYGSKIASLLRLEVKGLSEYQTDDILNSAIGYYGQDLVIVDNEGAFVYDDEYFEQIEFFESVNVEQLELQYFDRVIDERLNHFYRQSSFKLPLSAYIPLVNRNVDSPGSRLAKLRVDISVVTERLEGSIKLVGDAYYSRLYALLTEKLSIREWRDSIQRKLDIIKDLYQVHQDRMDIIHGEILEFTIILLILFEIVIPFIKK